MTRACSPASSVTPMTSTTLKLLITYKYEEDQLLKLLCARMLEDAFRARPDVRVFHSGEVEPREVDVVFNSPPFGDIVSGRLTAWWDTEACNFHREDQFVSDIVLAPYTCGRDYLYPADKTYLFPFATDPEYWSRQPVEYAYDVGFIGRGGGLRHKRMEWLQHVHDSFPEGRMLWTDQVERGVPVSRLLSSAKVLLQVSGDASGGVMETRFFEIGLLGPLVVDLTDVNRQDFLWAAEPDYHFIGVETKEEMVEKIRWLLENEDARLLMADRARRNYLLRHTYDVRARQFLETIGFLKGPGLLNFHTREGSA